MSSDIIIGSQFNTLNVPEVKTRMLDRLQNTADPKAAKQDAELRSACQEFESVLVAQMLKQMRESVPKSDVFGSQEKADMFQGMLDDETAKNISTTSSFGIADVIYSQLASQNIAKVSPGTVDKSIGKNTTD